MVCHSNLLPCLPSRVEGLSRVQGLSSKTRESSSAKRPVREDNRCRTIAPYSPDRRFWFAASLERNAARVRLVQAADVDHARKSAADAVRRAAEQGPVGSQ